MAVFLISLLSFGQLTGIKNIPGDYSSVAAAISALNTLGVGSGGVTFNVTAGYTESFPALTSGLITATGTSSNPIVFKKNGAGLNPVITAAVGTSADYEYIICLQGTDYITFDGIDVTDPAGLVEWGYAILKASGTDGAQYVTIKNCNITMNKADLKVSMGIYANNVTPAAPSTQLTVTALSGANSTIKIYGNTIQNAYNGIYLVGYNDLVSPYIYYDQGNEIGKDGANTISNFGGSTTANNGIYTIYQNNQKIVNNTVNGPCAGSGTCAGIQVATANNSNVDLYNNTISIAYTGTGLFYGIWDGRGNTYSAATTMNEYGNTVTNCSYLAGSGTTYYMYFNGGAASCNVYNNIVTNNTYGSATYTATGTLEGIYFNGCQNTTGVVSFHDNQVTNITRIQSTTSAGTTYYFYLNGGGATSSFFNNTINNNTVASNGTCYAMYVLNNPSGLKSIYGNTVTNLLNSYGSIYGIYTGNAGSTSVYNNKFQNFNALGASSLIYGIYLSSGLGGGPMYCYNNFVGDFKAPATSSASAIYGINAPATSTTTLGIYNNTVYINASSTGANFGTIGLYIGTGPTNVELQNNIIVNTSAASGTGFTVALRFSTATPTNYALTSNNNDYFAGTPGAQNLIYYDGTNSDQNLASYKNRYFPRDSQSLTENPPFLSVTPGAMNLHINAATATQVESAGLVVSTPNINTDIDGDPRYPNVGYPFNDLYPPIAPDLGADEFGGIPLDQTSPFISYSPLMNTSSLSARILIATISDMRGVPVSGIGLPRIAWKKFYNGTWSYATATSSGGNQYRFTFAGGVSTGDTIYYYVLAQDSWTTPNTGSYPIVGAGGFSANPPTAATPPATPFKYAVVPSICGTFNVGAGQTYPTLTAAISDLNLKEMTCPVTLLLTDNSYTSETLPIIINQIPGAAPGVTLTIKPAPGKTPVITGFCQGNTPYYWSMISFNGAQYVIFDGSNTNGGTDRSLTLLNTGTTGFVADFGMYNNGTIGASNITIKNCVIQTHAEPAYNAQGVSLFATTGNAGYSNITIDNNTINSQAVGIRLAGIATNKSTNITVTNNTIGSLNTSSAVDLGGVTLTYTDNVLIQGNEIIGNSAGLNVTSFPYGIYVSTGSTNTQMRKNIIHDWYQWGTAFPSSGAMGIYYGGDASVSSEISNNVVYNIKGPGQNLSVTGANPFGIYIPNSEGNLKIYHNTVYLSGAFLTSSTDVMSSCIGIGNTVSNVDIRDNILKNSSQLASGTSNAESYAITVGTNPTGLTMNNNDYFVDGVGPKTGYYGGADQATLANWQAATSQDANSTAIDPVFTSATFLKPTTTSMNHSGTYLTLVPTDILNIPRTNPPDVGAYEYSLDPIVVTTSSGPILYNGATLNGSIMAAGLTVNSFFDYGVTTAYGSNSAGVPAVITGNTTTAYLSAVTGLLPLTTYHFRARGLTSANVNVYGNDMTFTTAPLPPAVVTTNATAITSAGATLNGTVNPNGGIATVSFQYGLTNSYGNTVLATQSPVSGSSVTSVSAPITGLQPYTTYHFMITGTNAGGTSNGNDMTFTTSAVVPAVVTNFASPVGTTTATLNGTVTAYNASTTVTFQWGATTSYGNTANGTPGTVTGMAPTAVSASLTGLSINSTYHFRCVGTNVAGTTYGLDQTFHTNCVSPVPTITGPASVCQGMGGYTYTTEAGNSSYTWAVTGGTITGGQGTSSVTVTWSTLGAQTISVNYNNQYGCSASSPTIYNVTVYALPNPTISGNNSICQGYSVVYTTQAGQSGYIWSVTSGGQIQSGQGTSSVTVLWNTTGAQTVSVNYTNTNGCTAASPTSYPVTVLGSPTPTITGPGTACADPGFNVNYTTETVYTGYIWAISAGGSINSGQGTNQVQVTWNSGGAQTISVNYTNGNGCSAASATVLNVTVTTVPDAAGSITGTSSVCGGTQGVAYSCPPINGSTYTMWNLPAGASIASGAGTTSITVNYAANASSGDITVYGTNSCGNGPQSPPFHVTVTALPAAAGTITGYSAVCQGSNGLLYSVTPIANATSYTWTIPTGATIVSGGNTDSIMVDFGNSAISGYVTVYGSNSCGNGAVSPSFQVTVNPIPPTPVITANGYVLTSSAAQGNQWYHNGNSIPGATGQTYTVPPAQGGWYWTMVDLQGCSSDTSNHIYIVGVGVGEEQGVNINIYPVPNDGNFTVSISGNSADPYTITVFSNLGVEIHQVKDVYVNGRTDQRVNLGSAASGIYTVIIRNGSNQWIRKVIVTK